jgi:hypothetical protein
MRFSVDGVLVLVGLSLSPLGTQGLVLPTATTTTASTARSTAAATFSSIDARPSWTSSALFASTAAAASAGEEVPMTSPEDKPLSSKATSEEKPSKQTTPAVSSKQKKTYQELRAEGGPLTVNTPIGALNPFALYYGITSILLGIPWFISCKICQLLYFITGNRFDKKVCMDMDNASLGVKNDTRIVIFDFLTLGPFLTTDFSHCQIQNSAASPSF